MHSKKKTKRILAIVLGLLFLALPMADACMLEHMALGGNFASDHSTMPCKTLPSPETAKRFCNLSDQHRSLQSAEQPFSVAVLCEDGLSLIADAMKPAQVLTGRVDVSLSNEHPPIALFIIHRSLLI